MSLMIPCVCKALAAYLICVVIRVHAGSFKALLAWWLLQCIPQSHQQQARSCKHGSLMQKTAHANTALMKSSIWETLCNVISLVYPNEDLLHNTDPADRTSQPGKIRPTSLARRCLCQTPGTMQEDVVVSVVDASQSGYINCYLVDNGDQPCLVCNCSQPLLLAMQQGC